MLPPFFARSLMLMYTGGLSRLPAAAVAICVAYAVHVHATTLLAPSLLGAMAAEAEAEKVRRVAPADHRTK